MTRVGVPTGNTYDKEASTHRLERRMVSGFASSLRSLMPPGVSRVLEVGCGEGNQLRRVRELVPAATVVGLDLPDPVLAAQWSGLGFGYVMQGSALELPVRDRAVDLVLALEVIEHVEDPHAALAEIARVASRWAIVSVPWEPVWRAGNVLRGRYVRQAGNTPGHVGHYGRRSFLRLVSRHLRVDAVRRPFPWTMVRASVA